MKRKIVSAAVLTFGWLASGFACCYCAAQHWDFMAFIFAICIFVFAIAIISVLDLSI